MADSLEIKRKWVTSYVAFLAHVVRDYKDELGGFTFDQGHMIVLADALEAAGCKSLDVLSALRLKKYALQHVIVERIILRNLEPRIVGRKRAKKAKTAAK